MAQLFYGAGLPKQQLIQQEDVANTTADQRRFIQGLLHFCERKGVEVVTPADSVQCDDGIDIGPKTQSNFSDRVAKAHTVLMIDSIGPWRQSNTTSGIETILHHMAQGFTQNIVIGKEAVAAYDQYIPTGSQKPFQLISNSQAALAFLGSLPLAGLEAMNRT